MAGFDEQAVWQQTQEQYNKNKLDDVEKKLQLLADNTDNPSWYLYLLANVQQERLKAADALKTIEKSIEVNSEWSYPHALRAQLLQQLSGGNLADLYLAQMDIDRAIRLLPLENISDTPIEDPGALQGALNNYVNTLAGLYGQKNSIDNEIKSRELLNRVNELDSKIDNERLRSIEILGVFAAIIALLIITGQAALTLKGLDFLWLGLGLVVPIAFLILLISPRSYKKTPWRGIVGFSVFVLGCAAVGAAIYKWIIL